MSDMLVLEILRDTLKAITRLAHGNKAAVSGICGDAMRKIDAAIGPAVQQRRPPTPQHSYGPAYGPEEMRKAKEVQEELIAARAAKYRQDMQRLKQGNGIQPMPHGQADDFADEQ